MTNQSETLHLPTPSLQLNNATGDASKNCSPYIAE